ncbi:MAG TPA: hypothetical protein EYN66_23350 [Myxococcales bacterium]|nr:hypothetical protein [Myxococcales bacterium]
MDHRTAIPKRTLHNLDYQLICDRLAALARTDLGARAVGAPSFYSGLGRVQLELDLTTEMVGLWNRGQKPPMGGIKDVTALVVAGSKDRVLEAEEILEVADCVRGIWLIRAFVDSNADDTPLVFELSSACPDMGDFHDQLYALFDPKGCLADSASKELKSLRVKARALHQKIRVRVDAMLADLNVQEHLQDSYFTVREDRYVLPVRSGGKPHIPGIIHGNSQTGHTLYVEPETLVPFNNELKLCEQAIAIEERRILAQCSQQIGSMREDIFSALEVVTAIDSISARARLAIEMEASSPQLNSQGHLSLKNVRNPILVLRGVDVIPNEIAVGKDWQILVLSGPNAGGKTVTLSSVGLSALMVRAGLHIPADADSQMPLLDRVLMIKGDQQDLSADLSTFSGHLKRLQEVLAQMDARSLILVDEIVVGTEPEQGAALAIAVVEQIAALGGIGIVTTHYKRLKTLSLADSRFQNASVQMDSKSQRPNYQLTLGSPGASSAIDLAEQMGLDAGIIARARELWGQKEESLEVVLQELGRERDGLALELAAVEQQRARLETETERYNKSLLEIEERGDEMVRLARLDALEDVETAKKALAEVVRELQRDPSVGNVQRRRNKVKVIEQQLSDGESGTKDDIMHPALSHSEVVLGASCFVPAFNKDGIITEIRGVNAVVQIGSINTTVAMKSLKQPMQAPKGQKAPLVNTDPVVEQLPPKIAQNSCDVRGQRLDEALDQVEAFLDNALLTNRPVVYIIHGHGTGRLKAGIRESFDSSRYVRKHGPADREHGGDGVTVVWLL